MSDIERMHIGTAVELLIYFLVSAYDDKTIDKPLSWSLYQAWRVVDRKEKPRKAKEQNE